MKTALVTGSAGLVGSEAVRFLAERGWAVVGVDNNMRRYFFESNGDTSENRQALEYRWLRYRHWDIDIRNSAKITALFRKQRFDFIVHAAAQPSHDWAAREPLTDFSVNAMGTMVLLEAARQYCPTAPFVFVSTNKVYGDAPNQLPIKEQATRFEIDLTHRYHDGIDETMSLDQTLHSVFGASKVAADVMVQEYGRYFNMPTGVFRGGCLTGPTHVGTQLHGFLSYLVKCVVTGTEYVICGYKGKQVRDNMHARDAITMFYEFYQNPQPGAVYNMGGGRRATVSILEAIEKIEQCLGYQGHVRYMDEHRVGDHIWYISDVTKFRQHYPEWSYQYSIDDIIEELCRAWEAKSIDRRVGVTTVSA